MVTARAFGLATSLVVAAAGRHLRRWALNRVSIAKDTTTFVLHVDVIGHDVPRQYGAMSHRR